MTPTRISPHRTLARSASILGLLAAAAFVPATTADAGTLAYWRFEDGPALTNVIDTGATGYNYNPDVADSSGNGNELAVWETGGGAGFAYRGNVPSSLIQPNATVNNFSIKNTGGFPASFTDPAAAISNDTYAAWTIEASYRPETGGFRTVVGRDGRNLTGTDANLAALYLQAQPDNSLAIKYVDEDGVFHQAVSAPGVVQGFSFGSDPEGATGVWHNIAAVSDGSTLSLYLDKTGVGKYVLIAQTALGGGNTALTDGLNGAPGGADIAGAGFWTAGDWSVGRGMYAGAHGDRAYGLIDEVRISDSALAPSQLLFARTQVPIVNGSFEDPVVAGGGPLDFPGWNQGADTGLIDDKTAANGVGPGNPPVAADGDQIGFLGNGTAFTNIWQDFTDPLIGDPRAVAYTFTIAMGIRTDFGETPGTNGTIEIGLGDLTGVGAFATTAVSRSWLSNEFKYYSVTLSADSVAPGDFLRVWVDKLAGNSLIVVDDAIFTVVLVPAPAALPAGLALIGLASMRRRRR